VTRSPASATICRENHRRADAIRADRNGLDFVDVGDDCQSLSVYFFGPAPREIEHRNFTITEGTQVQNLRVVEVRHAGGDDPYRENCLKVRVDRPGDHSTYRLAVVDLPGFDPRFTSIAFNFGRPPDIALDCAMPAVCPPEPLVAPDLDYLAKDYESFRQLILDRLSLNVPDWTERHVPDIGITLVELLAYVGDQLSYFQDAVATEAYLDTARLRISVRRHARLVDYKVHEGCNARAWVSIETDTDVGPFAAGEAFFTTEIPGIQTTFVSEADAMPALAGGTCEAFEPVRDAPIAPLRWHSRIQFYTWGDAACCLPKGSTAATLLDGWLTEPKRKRRKRKLATLRAGDVLLFEEVIDPLTGSSEDADPRHRHAVRLTSVRHEVDELYDTPIVEVAWAVEDRLPFALCISAPNESGPGVLEDVSIARGNVVLVDHGLTLDAAESLGLVPESGPFRPTLQQAGLTFRQAPALNGPSASAVVQDARVAVPQLIDLASSQKGREPIHWTPQYDLLASGPSDAHVVVEMDDNGYAHLRFGDGDLGMQPEPGADFTARYRVGNGLAGNVGSETIGHIVLRAAATVAGATVTVRNPLPASGGLAAEDVAQVKLLAPKAFRLELQRAVSADDYARIAERNPAVQRAAATLRWSGSRYTVRVAIDPLGSETVGDDLLAAIATDLENYRRIGHDVVVVPASYVPLDLAIRVTVRPDFLRGHVASALLDVFSNRTLPDGSRGVFHPDNLTFGDDIYTSKLVAAAQAVTGVLTAQVTRLARMCDSAQLPGVPAPDALRLGPLEVAQLDNDATAPERGRLRVHMICGR
jgi:hypothetical protein